MKVNPVIRYMALLVGIIFACVGGSFLLGGGAFYYVSYVVTRDWLPASGEVERLTIRTSYDDETGRRRDIYCPVVRFMTQTEEEVTAESTTCASPAAYRVGDRAELLYNPARPEQIQLQDRTERQALFFILGFGFVGGIMLVAGAVTALIGVKGWREVAPPSRDRA